MQKKWRHDYKEWVSKVDSLERDMQKIYDLAVGYGTIDEIIEITLKYVGPEAAQK